MQNPINSKRLQKQLANSAQSYAASSDWLREIADEMISRLDAIQYKPKRILDLGGADGYAALQLKKCFPKAEVVNLDLSLERLKLAEKPSGLLKKAKFTNLCADMQHLPFAKNSFDMVFANISFHTAQLDKVLAEIARVLQHDGLLLFSFLGPDTLIELRQAFATIDQNPHVYLFPDMHDVGDRLLKQQLQGPVMDVERQQVRFKSVDGLIKMLTQMGERLCHQDRAKYLLTPRKWQQMVSAYPKNENSILASFEIVFGHAWGREVTQTADPDGTVYVSLDSLKKTIGSKLTK